jgi:hypothetical protein
MEQQSSPPQAGGTPAPADEPKSAAEAAPKAEPAPKAQPKPAERPKKESLSGRPYLGDVAVERVANRKQRVINTRKEA